MPQHDNFFEAVVLGAICALLLLCAVAFLTSWPGAQDAPPSARATGPIVLIAPVAKPAVVHGDSASPSKAGTDASAPRPASTAQPTKHVRSGPDAEWLAYVKAYRNAERANQLLGEPRYDTGPYNLLNRHTL
jgi:hypothetical protein